MNISMLLLVMAFAAFIVGLADWPPSNFNKVYLSGINLANTGSTCRQIRHGC